MRSIALGAMLAVGAISVANAAEIGVVASNASSTFFTYNLANLTNGSGLSGGLHSGDFNTKWLADRDDTMPTVTFDLGAIQAVRSTQIWNYGGGCCGGGRSVQSLAVYGSTDGVGYSLLANLGLAQNDVDPIPSQTFALNGDVRYIRFNVLSNYGDIYTGLSEVKFFDTFNGGVPEPQTWSLLILGFGMAGVAMRRRGRTRTTVAFA